MWSGLRVDWQISKQLMWNCCWLRATIEIAVTLQFGENKVVKAEIWSNFTGSWRLKWTQNWLSNKPHSTRTRGMLVSYLYKTDKRKCFFLYNEKELLKNVARRVCCDRKYQHVHKTVRQILTLWIHKQGEWAGICHFTFPVQNMKGTDLPVHSA